MYFTMHVYLYPTLHVKQNVRSVCPVSAGEVYIIVLRVSGLLIALFIWIRSLFKLS